MANPIIFDGESHRQMTDAEHAQWQADAVETQKAAEIAAAIRKSALSKLAALGLTEAEIKALVG